MPANESVDQTLMTSVERVKTSRDLLDQIDQMLARGAEILDGPQEIDLRELPDED